MPPFHRSKIHPCLLPFMKKHRLWRLGRDPTGHRGAESDKGDGVDTVLEVDEAAEVSGHVTDDGSAHANSGDGHHEGGVPGVDG